MKESISGNKETAMKISDLKLEWQDKSILIVGSGATGISCAHFLSKHGFEFTIVDSRTSVANVVDIKQHYNIILGEFQEHYFTAADILIVSPGVSIKHPFIQTALQHGKEIIGDVDLFCRLTDAPVIAITGSNGKSTVTTLVGEILNAANLKAKVGGNLGVPCLDLLADIDADCYVLELSSFQLETTRHLKACASVILNLSEDHMDRYASFADYCKAKQQILENSKNIIVNLDDELAVAASKVNATANRITFSLSANVKADFYIAEQDGNEWVYHNGKAVIDISNIKIVGQHNKLNILAALSLCSVFDFELAKTQRVITDFAGLAHRSQVISSTDGVLWINDSKATNIGATTAALKGFSGRSIHLLLGGQGKGQNFSELVPALTSNILQIIIYGEDAPLILSALQGKTNIKLVRKPTLEQSVEYISQTASKDDVVLLSPACASFDQFDNYMHRGQSFVDIVTRICNR